MSNPPEEDDSIWEVFKALKRHRQQLGYARREDAEKEYLQVRDAMKSLGYELKKHSDTHYSLRSPKGWILNVYPGNQRLYRDPNQKIRPPFINLPTPWTLTEVAEAFALAEKKQTDKEIEKTSEIIREELQQ